MLDLGSLYCDGRQLVDALHEVGNVSLTGVCLLKHPIWCLILRAALELVISGCLELLRIPSLEALLHLD